MSVSGLNEGRLNVASVKMLLNRLDRSTEGKISCETSGIYYLLVRIQIWFCY